MSLSNTQVCSEVASALLRGAQLDTIRAYSLIIQLGFIRPSASDGLPAEIWVSVSGDLVVNESSSTAGYGQTAGNFFEHRALALSAIYYLIGKEVTGARVLESGALQIDFAGKGLRAESSGDDNLEEVWAVMSDTPVATAEHRWYVSLNDSGALSACAPT